jgi:hypothetical protein
VCKPLFGWLPVDYGSDLSLLTLTSAVDLLKISLTQLNTTKSGEYNPTYQLVYDQRVMPHNIKPPALTHTLKPNKPVGPQLSTSQKQKVHATHTKNC